MRPKRKRREQRKKNQERNLFKLLGSIALILCVSMILVGCANPKKSEVQTYKPLLGKKCTKDGKVKSYFWMHTVYGPDVVKKEWCKNG